MNVRRVWLPPDGDRRLVRLQEAVGEALGRPGMAAIPPHLVLDVGQTVTGPLSLGPWALVEGEVALPVREPRGTVGWLRLGLAWDGTGAEGLPPVPQDAWTRGRLGTLTWEPVPGGVLWSWSDLAGWKAALPRG